MEQAGGESSDAKRTLDVDRANQERESAFKKGTAG
jgi:hypothetical protein